MAGLVVAAPYYNTTARLWDVVAPALASMVPAGALQGIQLCPAGVIRLIEPLRGNEFVKGLDLFSLPEPLVSGVRYGAAHPGISIDGPFPDVMNTSFLIAVRTAIRVPVSGPDEDLGLPDTPNPVCGAPCGYDPVTRTRFWGFAASTIMLNAVGRVHTSHTTPAEASPLEALAADGYEFELFAPPVNGQVEGTVIASSGGDAGVRLRQPVEVAIPIVDVQWFLRLAPPSGSWMPSWFGGVVAAVVVLSAAAGMLLFAVLASRQRNRMLLRMLLPRELLDGLKAQDALQHAREVDGADTPADVLSGVLSSLLLGEAPDLRDVVLLRTVLHQGRDVYRPFNLGGKLKAANLDSDVAGALLKQLGAVGDGSGGAADPWAHPGPGFALEVQPRRGSASSQFSLSLATSTQDFHTSAPTSARFTTGQPGKELTALQRALMFVLSDCAAPQPAALLLEPPTADVSRHGKASMAGAWEGPRTTDTAPQQPTYGLESTSGTDVRAESMMGMGITSGVTPSAAVELLPGGDGLSTTADDCGDEYETTSSVGGSTVAGTQTPGGLRLGTGVGARLVCPPRAASGTGMGAATLPASGNVLLLTGAGAGSGQGSTAVPSSPRRLLTSGRRGVPGVTSPAVPDTDGLGGSTSRVPSAGIARSIAGAAGGARCILHFDSQKNSEVWEGLANGAPQPQPQPGAASLAPLPAPAPPPPLIDQVESLLAVAASPGQWQFNMFQLAEASGGHALSTLGFFLCVKEGLVSRFGLKPTTLARLLRTLEAGYTDNPYHNATHAADVLRSLHVLLMGTRLTDHYLDPLGLLAAYMAAIVHDLGHPGLTGDFLVATSAPLALRYNDNSPLESHHASAAFTLLAERPELDALAPLSKEQRSALRKMVIDLVLGTDMKQHFAMIAQYKAVRRPMKEGESTSRGMSPSERNTGGGGAADAAADAPAGNGAAALTGPLPLDETERLLSLQMCLKAADLGHLGSELEVHKRWLAALEEEFFLQGDREKALGLPISPLFDRSKQGASKSQVGFFDFVALPLIRTLGEAFPGARPIQACFEANYAHWKEVQEAQQAGSGQPSAVPLPKVSASKQTSGEPVMPVPVVVIEAHD
ncbi:hypothetical protein HYH03_014732 [Edaphochlamys debaryana]|uniref:PDEase domain-containing protein n=1 Tax=Edaphochlamys debaryana TaxID=47281 RepID=A0A835XQT2_9CHLO|nr:hypothetical protein HYH03_014732 [Edaphochlamys debaryana]|eukprot:KAG2486561.1 hypothetical protein HYH03_014732 [Edaphochlamys debaryana]